MPLKPYENKEYIDFLSGTDFNGETVLVGGGPDRATAPVKVSIRDVGLAITGIVNGTGMVIEWSPDDMETQESALDPDNMTWVSRDDGTFTAIASANIWENAELSEGWMRIRFTTIDPAFNAKIQMRPRAEKVI